VWEDNALRHSFTNYRLAAVPNTAQVALEAGNSPQMIFGHYRELVRAMDAGKWFGITPEAVEAAQKQAGVCGECEAVCEPEVPASAPGDGTAEGASRFGKQRSEVLRKGRGGGSGHRQSPIRNSLAMPISLAGVAFKTDLFWAMFARRIISWPLVWSEPPSGGV
jgi:hypothetical protein